MKYDICYVTLRFVSFRSVHLNSVQFQAHNITKEVFLNLDHKDTIKRGKD